MHYQLTYEPDDDTTAREIVAHELREPNIARWRAMTTPRYLLQTYRVLCALDRHIAATFARRKAHLATVHANYRDGIITDEERHRRIAEFACWKANAITFRDKVHNRRDQLVPRVREIRGDHTYQHICDAYLTLATAIADHRDTTLTNARTTPADRLLWARLDTLDYPLERAIPQETMRVIPLAEAVTRARNTTPPRENP